MNLDRKLMAYAAGAVAAGAAGTQSADAAVVYSPGFSFAVKDTKAIDFDHNNLEEFNLGHEREGEGATQQPNTDRLILKDRVSGGSDGYVIDPDNTFNVFPAPLAAGAVIGPDQLYGQLFNNNTGNRIVDEDSNNNNVVDDGENDIPNQTNFAVDNIVGNPQYLGVRFKLNNEGDDRYGYIGIDITNAADLTGNVTSFAFEDTGEAILAGAVPEPSSGLALLALGAAGMLRRKRA